MNLKFAVEKPLGRLAKWLRILGFDTLYEQQDAAGGCFESISKNRIRLSRKRKSCTGQNSKQLVFIVSNHYSDQLREVIRALDISLESIQPFTRCIRCNTRTVAASKEVVSGKVPDYVWETQQVYQTCSRCNRIYWRGSHIAHSVEKIKRLFDLRRDENITDL